MIILRITLYIICIISIGWSILIFGGPPIIKRIISGYSDGALIPSDIIVSPGLNISISRLDFVFQNEIDAKPIEGFSRAIEIAWSLFGEKPFVEINIGPSVLKDHGTLKNINIYTPSFQDIDGQNISLNAELGGIVTDLFGKMHSLTFAGNLNLESANLSNVNIEAEKFDFAAGGSTYSANLIRSKSSDLNLNVPIDKQLLSSTFVFENLTVSEFELTAPEATFEVIFSEDSRNFKFASDDLKIKRFGGFLKTVKVDGNFNQFNVLEELKVEILDGMFLNKLPKFSAISAIANKSGNEKYKANVEGNWGKFDLSNSDYFIGSLPGAKFAINSELDRAESKLTSKSKIKLNTLSETDITGSVEAEFRSESLTKLRCAFADCELSDLDFSYTVNFDEEWLMGSASCPKGSCGLTDLDHFVRTSNTMNIFAILNEAKILSPISSLYFYSAISSGQKINEGHELKFQF